MRSKIAQKHDNLSDSRESAEVAPHYLWIICGLFGLGRLVRGAIPERRIKDRDAFVRWSHPFSTAVTEPHGEAYHFDVGPTNNLNLGSQRRAHLEGACCSGGASEPHNWISHFFT